MIYTKPNYYDEFYCIADKCSDTCCAGWQIVIDDVSLERYENEKSDYREQLLNGIDWQEEVFKQKAGKRCTFLNEKNLCEMYLNLGEGSLCDTCTKYPRHIEEFENIREYTLSVSCPEVAKILLHKKEPVEFISIENEEEEEFEEYDPFLFSILEDAREIMRKILQNRSVDISVRAALVWKLSDEMQECVDTGELFACYDILERYEEALQNILTIEERNLKDSVKKEIEKEDYRKELSNIKKQENIKWQDNIEIEVKNWKNDIEKTYHFSIQIYKKIYCLERLSENWECYLKETEKILYMNGAEEYGIIRKEFYRWLEKYMPEWNVQVEQLLVYFIYTYFCGAVYDGAIIAKARMSIISVYFIYEMLMARWQKNEQTLDIEDIIFMVYKYSRELEHSDENLNFMEEMMEELI